MPSIGATLGHVVVTLSEREERTAQVLRSELAWTKLQRRIPVANSQGIALDHMISGGKRVDWPVLLSGN